MAGHLYYGASKTPIKKAGACLSGATVTKLKHGYVWQNGSFVPVWSGSSEVTRYIRGIEQPIVEVAEGEDVISALPTPIAENAVFVGWATTNGDINIESSLIATGNPMTVYAVFDYPVISNGSVTNSSFIQSTNSKTTYAYSDSPRHYGGSWTGRAISSETPQWGSFSNNFVLASKAVGMRCSCDLYAYTSGRGYDKANAYASISGIGTYYGAWQNRRRYNPEFTVESSNRTFSFAGEYSGISVSWGPATEAGCVSLTLRGN